jgi:hypothetical protein
MSPSSIRFKDGEFNTSMLNSCPLNNFDCHLNQNLHSEEIEKLLAQRVITSLLKSGYEMTEKDVEFYKQYPYLYAEKVEGIDKFLGRAYYRG